MNHSGRRVVQYLKGIAQLQDAYIVSKASCLAHPIGVDQRATQGLEPSVGSVYTSIWNVYSACLRLPWRRPICHISWLSNTIVLRDKEVPYFLDGELLVQNRVFGRELWSLIHRHVWGLRRISEKRIWILQKESIEFFEGLTKELIQIDSFPWE